MNVTNTFSNIHWLKFRLINRFLKSRKNRNMNILLVHPENEKQDKAIRAVFEAMQIRYEEEPELDETERILANADAVLKLDQSIKEAKEGRVTKIAIDDLWK